MYNIKKFVMGPLQSNSYIIWNDKKEAYLFDIGDINISTIINFIKENNLNLNGLFLTHGHIDHIWGVDILINNYPNIIVYIGDNEKDYLENSEYNLSYSIFREIFTIKNLQTASESQTAARSRIMDADFAQETATLARQQVLQQAGIAMLSQANQMPSQVLSLLR